MGTITVGPSLDGKLKTNGTANGTSEWMKKDTSEEPNIALIRLVEQINYFSKGTNNFQNKYKWLRGSIFFAAAAITVSAAFAMPSWVVPCLGAVIVVVESFLQMNAYQQGWQDNKKIAEKLNHEKYLYLGKAGPYRNEEKAATLLAERVEGILSADYEAWLSLQNEMAKSGR